MIPRLYDWLNCFIGMIVLNWDHRAGSLDLCSNFLSAVCAQSTSASKPKTRVLLPESENVGYPKTSLVRKIIMNHQILGSDKPGEAMDSRESPEWSLQESEVEDLRPLACSLLTQKREPGGGQ